MLWSTSELRGLPLMASDGEIGSVRDLYFDDARWAVRYLVARTGDWLDSRDVLISPHAIGRLDRDAGQVQLSVTRAQIERAPDVDADKPVSRQQETALHDHYGHPHYWSGGLLWGGLAFPVPLPGTLPLAGTAPPVDPLDDEMQAREERALDEADPHLRSSAEVTGYVLRATDGTIGRIDDMLFDERSWEIVHVVVDTRSWWPGGEVLLPRNVVTRFHWGAREADVRVTRQAVKDAPPWQREPAARDESVRRVQLHFERWI